MREFWEGIKDVLAFDTPREAGQLAGFIIQFLTACAMLVGLIYVIVGVVS